MTNFKYKISTWNLDRPKQNTERTKLILDKIRSTNSDILVLTETSNAIDLSKEFEFSLKSKPFERTPNEQWITIWSKWEILQQLDTFNNNRTTCGKIKTPFGEIIIYGTIIPYHMAGVSGVRYGNLNYKTWQYHEEDIFNQSEDWKRIISKNLETPFFIIGDFNQCRTKNQNGYGTDEMRELLSNKLNINGLICITEKDFSGNYLTTEPRKATIRKNIDHICISKNWIEKLENYEVGAWNHFNENDTLMSDHNGVFLTFD